MSAAVFVSPPEARVTEALAAAVLARFPTLAEHVCKSAGIGLLPERLPGSTLPHLVEHIAIDLLVRWQRQDCRPAGATPGAAAATPEAAGATPGAATATPPAAGATPPAAGSNKTAAEPKEDSWQSIIPVAGNTTWEDREQGLMRVRISAEAGTTVAEWACAALQQAVEEVNLLLNG
ncbi:MAG: hypothetical protein LBR39_04770 [Coriobacteriales bacterium]|nr:hypothetical protein [Coriobacteriales bacterium]